MKAQRPPTCGSAGKLREPWPCRRLLCARLKPSPRKDRGLAGAHSPPGEMRRGLGRLATPWGHRRGRAAACREEPWAERGPAPGFPQPRDPGSSQGPPGPHRGVGAVHRLQSGNTPGEASGSSGCSKGEGRAGEPGAQLQPFISRSQAIRQMTEGERQPVQALRPRLLPLGDLSPGFIQQTC